MKKPKTKKERNHTKSTTNWTYIHHIQPPHYKKRSTHMCGVDYTIKHIITECQKYEDMRKKHYISQQIREMLGPGPQSTTNIIQLYNLI